MSRCYFLLHVDDSLTIGRKAREHYNRLAARYEIKDVGMPQTWCGIEFIFLPDTIILHQTAYRKHFVEHWRKHPVRIMTVTPHLSPIKQDALGCIRPYRSLVRRVLRHVQLAADHRSGHHTGEHTGFSRPGARHPRP